MSKLTQEAVIEKRELYARAIDNIDLEIEDWKGYFAGTAYQVEDMLDDIIIPLELKRDGLNALYKQETGEDYVRVLFIDREKPALPDSSSGRPLKPYLQGGK